MAGGVCFNMEFMWRLDIAHPNAHKKFDYLSDENLDATARKHAALLRIVKRTILVTPMGGVGQHSFNHIQLQCSMVEA